ncbi:PaaI family thioesterase [Pseudophaeobacter flagellatus]|uniref:PaaI family thioesterase n=1 Tax=Pseudophaeobacter flagellatus TaxID=2899119 RepID=UPI001E5481B5|nr:PaaI family thioesterase [Pseudophaeobacter flagellatus]MCD9148302.1 PaaI family thioesterase [Pseudophaeobacter flagellatus]
MTLAPPDQAPDPFFEIEDPGVQQLVGYKTTIDRRDGSCLVTLDLEPPHLNRHGILHGGIVATVLDVVCGNTASQFFDRKNHAPLVTVSLTLSYVAAARAGRVSATARVTGGGASIAHVFGELVDAEGQLLATATGVFKRIKR